MDNNQTFTRVLQKQKNKSQIFKPDEINKLVGRDMFDKAELNKAYAEHGGIERYMDDIKDAVMHKINIALPNTEEYDSIRDGISEGITEGIERGLGEYVSAMKIAQERNTKYLMSVVEKSIRRPEYKTVTERLIDKGGDVLNPFKSLRGFLSSIGIEGKENGILDTSLTKREDKNLYIKQATSLDSTLSKSEAAKQFEEQQKIQKAMLKNQKEIEAFINNGWSLEKLKDSKLLIERDKLAKSMESVDPRFKRDATESEIEANENIEKALDVEELELKTLEEIRDNLSTQKENDSEKKKEKIEESKDENQGIFSSLIESLSSFKDLIITLKPILAGIGSVLAVAGAAYAGWKAGQALNDNVINPLVEKVTGVKGNTLGSALYDVVDKIQDKTGNSLFGESDAEKLRKIGIGDQPIKNKETSLQYDELGNYIGAVDSNIADTVEEATVRNKKIAQQQINMVVGPTSNTINNKTISPSYTPKPKQQESSIFQYISGRFAF